MAKLNSKKTEKLCIYKEKKFGRIDSWYICQFQQHFTSNFFVRKCFGKLLCVNSLGLQFFWGQKEIGAIAVCWWNSLNTSSWKNILAFKCNFIRKGEKAIRIWKNAFFKGQQLLLVQLKVCFNVVFLIWI